MVRRRACEDRGARLHHRLHPEAAAGIVCAQGPHGRQLMIDDAANLLNARDTLVADAKVRDDATKRDVKSRAATPALPLSPIDGHRPRELSPSAAISMPQRALFTARGWAMLGCVAALILVVLPLSNLALPAAHP